MYRSVRLSNTFSTSMTTGSAMQLFVSSSAMSARFLFRSSAPMLLRRFVRSIVSTHPILTLIAVSVFGSLNITREKFSSKSSSTARGSKSCFATLMAITASRSGRHHSYCHIFHCSLIIRLPSTMRSLANVLCSWMASGRCCR